MVPEQIDNGAGNTDVNTRVPGDELSPNRLQRARSVYRSYYTWLRASRLLMAAFLATAILYFLWIVPWLPKGLDTGDYSPKVAFTVYLLVGVTVLGMITLAIREWAWRKRESLMAWSTVYDEATGLHNRGYFFDRLALECERGGRGSAVFSVLVLQIRAVGPERGHKPPVSGSAMQRIAELINQQTHPADLVGLLSASELAILATGADREARRGLLARLREAVAKELPVYRSGASTVVVTGGAATYPVDGTEPAALVQAARAAAVVGSLSVSPAARPRGHRSSRSR